jgi:hypothetical protein
MLMLKRKKQEKEEEMEEEEMKEDFSNLVLMRNSAFEALNSSSSFSQDKFASYICKKKYF